MLLSNLEAGTITILSGTTDTDKAGIQYSTFDFSGNHINDRKLSIPTLIEVALLDCRGPNQDDGHFIIRADGVAVEDATTRK